MQEDVITGNLLTCTYDSLDEFAEAAERRDRGIHSKNHPDSWAGGASLKQALELARIGWTEQLPEALRIAESAVEMAEKEHIVDTFMPTWDVTGSEVDVARYLDGTPENMIEFPPANISKVGKVITLCASIGVSSSIEPETLIRRGQVITALALALGQLGHSVELWMDFSQGSSGGNGKVRVLVKGTNDELDPARILFAYAHPGALRALGFAVEHGYPARFRKALNVGGGYGKPIPPDHDLPEGTIYMPELKSAHDVPDADEFLRDKLKELGLLAE